MVSRTLTVWCPSGLANRLRVLVSGMAAAEVSHRTFRMIWPRTATCGATFGELLSNDWPVIDVDGVDPEWRARWVRSQFVRHRPDPVSDPRPDLMVGSSGWLLPREDRARCIELIRELEPIPALRDRMVAFQGRHFRPIMIGVHLRRGDFVHYRPDQAGNTFAAQTAVDRFLAEAPDAGILLCTDDAEINQRGRSIPREGVRELFRARYGARVVPSPTAHLDRRTVDGPQDALVDLLLLRATEFVVGTAGSSFSDLAVFGRPVRHTMVGGGTPEYQRWLRRARLTGTYWLALGVTRLVYGERLEFAVACHRLAGWKRRLKTRLHDIVRGR